jgi:glucose-1-phosphate thymidylyltransferase
VVIIPPVFIHPQAIVERSVIGPYVSIERGAQVRDSILRDVLVDEDAVLDTLMLQRSIIGRWTDLRGGFQSWNVGDSSTTDTLVPEELDEL